MARACTMQRVMFKLHLYQVTSKLRKMIWLAYMLQPHEEHDRQWQDLVDSIERRWLQSRDSALRAAFMH